MKMAEINESAKKILKAVQDLKKTKDTTQIKLLKEQIEDENKSIFEKAGIKSFKRKTSSEKIELPRPEKLTTPKIPKNIPKFDKEVKVEAKEFKNLTKKEKEKFMKELGIKKDQLEKILKKEFKRKKEIKKQDYSIYRPSEYGKIANKYAKEHADKLITKYPGVFKKLFSSLEQVDISILSRTYVSMMLFYTAIALPTLTITFLVLNLAFKLNILTLLLIVFGSTLATLLGFYFYPSSLIGQKNRKIKMDLPFAIVHMSAVAGSGAHPLSIFELIAQSDEYPELKKEIKKILNQVNLFGYNLTTALKNVARATPSPEFKELLNGMISTIETGGDLKAYLREKAEESLNTYKLDMKKHTEAIATYSEIYTAVLIAAPLLLIITLAIINSIGGKIAGLSVNTIAWIGVAGLMPLLNIGFMAFLNISEK